MTSGTLRPCLGSASAWRTCPTEQDRAGHRRSRSTCAASPGPPRSARSPSTARRLDLAEATYPADLKYHAEHDWARIDGDIATFGITWYAQEQLGEVVFFDPPEVGATITKDEPYAEVESVKAVSDVDRAAVAARSSRSTRRSSDAPEQINEDPYGEGWMVKIRLSNVVEADDLMDASAYEGTLT